MVSEGKLGAKDCYRVIIYIWAELSQRDCGPHFTPKWATMLHPILRQGIRLFIGTTSKTWNYILLSTRGRRSCYSRPKVALLAADGSITRGREQHEWRPRVDKFLKSFRADILFYPCEVMRRSWGAETTAHRPMFADKHRDRGTKSAMRLFFAVSEDKKQALWQFV